MPGMKSILIANRGEIAVRVVSDPATRVVLGGTVVGRYASELIAPIALAAQARLRVDQLVETPGL